MISKNTSGSQWRKWDLHIHTPDTAKADEYHSETDVWELFISKLEDEKEITVFGITDYFSMENYNKLVKYQKESERMKGKLLLPNVELRILPVTSSDTPINLHILFDNKLKYEDIEREFFRQLNFSYAGSKYACVRSDLITLGRAYKNDESMDESQAYKEGVGQYNVPFSDIKTILSSDFLKGHCLVGVSNHSKDGSSGIQHSALAATRREIYRLSDFIFSGNPSDINYFLGNGKDDSQKVISDYGSLKPCITGCDAHSFEKMFVFPENRYTWIKSDPTFEGLKQIVYEPQERVRIQETIPERKSDYQVIESISFENKIFGKQKIEFNQNLNTIIGGRSSGKSVLLGCLARLTGFTGEIKIDKCEYNAWISTLAESSHLTWKDKNQDNMRKIDYFGQSQINTLTSNTNEINNIVESIVKMSEDKKNNLDSYKKFAIKNKTDIINTINEWYSQKKQIEELNLQINEIGNEKGVELQIKKIIDEISIIKKKMPSSLSLEEEKEFSKLKETLNSYGLKNKTASSDISNLSSLKDITLLNTIDSAISSLSDNIHTKVKEFYLEIKNDTKMKWDSFIDVEISKIKELLQNINDHSARIINSELYKKGEQYFAENIAYSEKEKLLKSEQDKLNEIKRIKHERLLISQAKEKDKTELLSLYFKYYEKLLEILNNIQEQKDDVKISSSINCDVDKFNSIASESFNLKSGEGKNYTNIIYHNFDDFKKILTTIFEKLDCGEIQFKKDAQRTFISIFAENLFSLNYRVNYDNDDLDSMSEGKKAFIVLRLLLDFGDKEWPILIDQPEDDLDNRAIYDQLVIYLRSKKKQRQIILVTHNPNIVVGADSELVIVANQNGIKNKNQEDVKFEYYAASLETTFPKDKNVETILLSQGIREHVCDILEGGDKAFQIREKKYGYK
jgi:predicted ATPase